MKGHVQSMRRAWTGGLEPGFVAAYTSVGVGIGVGVDALNGGRSTLYSRRASAPGASLQLKLRF